MAKPKKFRAGFHEHISPAEYFAEPCPSPAATSSILGLIIDKSPAHARHAHPALNGDREEARSTAAQYLGSVVHRLALGKGREYQVVDADSWRTNAAKDARAAAEAAGLIPVLAPKFEEAQLMAGVLRDRLDEVLDGEPYETEVVIAWQEGGVWCRAMLDVWCERIGLALDLKTCTDASDGAVDRAFANGYARQDAWYGRGLSSVVGHPVDFGFLFVENSAPYLSRVARISEGFRHGAQVECLRALDVFRSCLSSGEWPGYPVRTVEPTTWLVRQWADAEVRELAGL